MHRHRPSKPARALLAPAHLLVGGAMLAAGCAQHVRIADAPPTVEEQPVTPLAGYGMELRVWALDATSWKRARNNAELENLYRQWLAIEAQRKADAAQEAEDLEPAPAGAGPPADPDDGQPATFGEFVTSQSQDPPQSPGLAELGRYASTRDALDATAERIWRQNGLQFALVPADQLSSLRDSMGVPGPLERTWWGATTAWSHLAQGIAFDSHRLDTDAGPLILGAGRMAIIGRAWPAPGVRGPVLRLEFCPQFVRADDAAHSFRSRLASRLEADDSPPSDLDAGPVFERLLLRGSIPRGYALIITASARAETPGQVGPMLAGSNIGQTTLSAVGPDGSLRPVALVIVPVLPEWFSLDGN